MVLKRNITRAEARNYSCCDASCAPCAASWLPLVSPSMFLPAFRLVRRAETNNTRTFTGTGIVLGCHKLGVCYCSLSCFPSFVLQASWPLVGLPMMTSAALVGDSNSWSFWKTPSTIVPLAMSSSRSSALQG